MSPADGMYAKRNSDEKKRARAPPYRIRPTLILNEYYRQLVPFSPITRVSHVTAVAQHTQVGLLAIDSVLASIYPFRKLLVTGMSTT